MKPRPPIIQTLMHGIRCRCPQCGKGRIFQSFYSLIERCGECGLEYEKNAGDSWVFYYVSVGAIPGLFLLVLLFLPPPDRFFVRMIWLGFFLMLLIGSMPLRKGLIIAADYLVRCYTEDAENETTEAATSTDDSRT